MDQITAKFRLLNSNYNTVVSRRQLQTLKHVLASIDNNYRLSPSLFSPVTSQPYILLVNGIISERFNNEQELFSSLDVWHEVYRLVDRELPSLIVRVNNQDYNPIIHAPPELNYDVLYRIGKELGLKDLRKLQQVSKEFKDIYKQVIKDAKKAALKACDTTTCELLVLLEYDKEEFLRRFGEEIKSYRDQLSFQEVVIYRALRSSSRKVRDKVWKLVEKLAEYMKDYRDEDRLLYYGAYIRAKVDGEVVNFLSAEAKRQSRYGLIIGNFTDKANEIIEYSSLVEGFLYGLKGFKLDTHDYHANVARKVGNKIANKAPITRPRDLREIGETISFEYLIASLFRSEDEDTLPILLEADNIYHYIDWHDLVEYGELDLIKEGLVHLLPIFDQHMVESYFYPPNYPSSLFLLTEYIDKRAKVSRQAAIDLFQLAKSRVPESLKNSLDIHNWTMSLNRALGLQS